MGNILSRRDFLKQGLSAVAAGFLVNPMDFWQHQKTEWADAERLGRVCVGKLDLRQHPSADSPSVGVLYEDAVVVWLREVLGETPGLALSRTWVETPDGYLYAPSVQPVFYQPNPVVETLPETEIGTGFWAEVTVPYVDFTMANPPARSPWMEEAVYTRLYYSQIMWIDGKRTLDDGTEQYRVNEKYGSYGDIFWADASAFRPLTEDEIAPISQDVEDKLVLIDINHQSMSCYENGREVYYCRISSGAKFNAWGEAVEEWETPKGEFFIWRKLVSTHMAGGTVAGGYDLPGIPWTCLFVGSGVAVHSTFWHNNYGTPRSHGCVNASPEDAKWVWRWTSPYVSLVPGERQVSIPFPSTKIQVVEV